MLLVFNESPEPFVAFLYILIFIFGDIMLFMYDHYECHVCLCTNPLLCSVGMLCWIYLIPCAHANFNKKYVYVYRCMAASPWTVICVAWLWNIIDLNLRLLGVRAGHPHLLHLKSFMVKLNKWIYLCANVTVVDVS